MYFLLFYIKRARVRVDRAIPDDALSRGGTGRAFSTFVVPLRETRERGVPARMREEDARALVPLEEHQRGGMAKETSSNLFRAFFNLVRGRKSCACKLGRRCERA